MTSRQHCRAIVIGAGMAGLMAAAALSDAFEDVLVIEKAQLPATPMLREGVPQGAHVLTFLGCVQGVSFLASVRHLLTSRSAR